MSALPQVNGRNLLSVDYDRSLRTEKIYDDHRKFLLKIIYDTQGHPTLWVPSSKLLSVNLTYSRYPHLDQSVHFCLDHFILMSPSDRLVAVCSEGQSRV